MAWLTGWTYRKEITVTNENADYQTWVLVGKTDDAIGEDVDCNGHVADDFDDLRFTGADGSTLLDYWIESIVDSGGTKLATVWVQNNATPDTTLYMYYGGTETAVSNGANTFIHFEDFEWGNDGDPLSDSGGSETITATNHGVNGSLVDIDTAQKFGGTRSGRTYRAGTASCDYSIQSVLHAEDIAVRFRMRTDGTHQNFSHLHGDGTKAYYLRFRDSPSGLWYYDTDNHYLGAISDNTWALIECYDFDWTNHTFDVDLNGANVGNDLGMLTTASYDDDLAFGNGGGTSESWEDDIIVRKWAATEPSFSFGSEETEPTGIIPIIMYHRKRMGVS